MSFLDGDLLLIVWRSRRERRTRPEVDRPAHISLGSVRRWLSRLPRPAAHHEDDTAWPTLRNYPYGPRI
jgi:hypothetical protein